MSVNVEWKVGDEGRGGVVAEGTYLWDAAKRLGVRLPAECAGRGECDRCAVVVEEGATLLSGLTEAERVGNLVLRPVPTTERAETTDEAARDLREEFRRMPLRKKFAALAGMEADMAYETLLRVADIPFALFGKGLDLLASRGRKLSQSEREVRRPAEHNAPPTDDKGPGEQPG